MSGKPWTPADVVHMRWYASRGFSYAECGKMLERSPDSIANKASELGVAFHGPDGAPFCNDNRRVVQW